MMTNKFDECFCSLLNTGCVVIGLSYCSIQNLDATGHRFH